MCRGVSLVNELFLAMNNSVRSRCFGISSILPSFAARCKGVSPLLFLALIVSSVSLARFETFFPFRVGADCGDSSSEGFQRGGSVGSGGASNFILAGDGNAQSPVSKPQWGHGTMLFSSPNLPASNSILPPQCRHGQVRRNVVLTVLRWRSCGFLKAMAQDSRREGPMSSWNAVSELGRKSLSIAIQRL